MLLDAIQPPTNADSLGSLILIGVFVSTAIWVVFTFVPIRAWIYVKKQGLDVTLLNLMGMRLRHIRPFVILNPMTRAKEAGVAVDVLDMEAHHMGGGDVDAVVDAMIAAKQKGEELTFEVSCEMDLQED